MTLVFVCLAFLSTVIATIKSSKGHPTVLRIIWNHDKISGAQSIRATDSTNTQVYNADCSNSLADGPFANAPLSVGVDENDQGQILVGDSPYAIRRKASTPRVTACEQFSNDSFSQLDFLMVYTGRLPEQLSAGAIPNCFRGSLGRLAKPQELYRRQVDDAGVLQRPGPQCGMEYPIAVVRNGIPVKKRLCRQITGQHSCGNGVCNLEKGVEISTTFSFGIEGTPGDKGWVSVGFGVEKTRTFTSNWYCEGENGDVLCMWADQPHVEYEVRRRRRSTGMCAGQVDEWDGDSFRLTSPLDNGEYTYCVRNTCRANEGNQYWDDLDRHVICAQNPNLAPPDWGF